MKKFMTRKHTEEHLSSRKERFSDLMGKGLFLLAFSSALSTNIWAQTTTTTNAQTTSQNFTGKVCDSKDGSSLIGCTVRVKGKKSCNHYRCQWKLQHHSQAWGHSDYLIYRI